MMEIISCAGYYGTGSSAVTDFFSEFDNIKSLGNTEFKFLQDCDGIAALEMNLIEHPHRHNTSHAIKRFIRASKFENGNVFSRRYKNFFGDNYMRFTMDYVREITQLQAECNWRGDAIERGELFYLLDALLSVISKKINRKWWTSILSLTHEQGYYTNIGRESFYQATRRYTSRLFNSVCEDSDYIMVDQLIPPSEIGKYMNYVENMKVVVVDRDPRDVYLEWVKYPYLRKFPYRVDQYCDWFRILRHHRKVEERHECSMLLRFEDLIYRYHDTADELMHFIGIDKAHHTQALSKFNPDVSIKNTRLWEKMTGYSQEIAYIEKALPEYLYPYE